MCRPLGRFRETQKGEPCSECGKTEDQPAANKLRIALQVREAMREHRKGKPIAFQPRRHP
jgi:hypothetical protein